VNRDESRAYFCPSRGRGNETWLPVHVLALDFHEELQGHCGKSSKSRGTGAWQQDTIWLCAAGDSYQLSGFTCHLDQAAICLTQAWCLSQPSTPAGVFGTDAVDTGIPAEVWRYYLLANRPEAQVSITPPPPTTTTPIPRFAHLLTLPRVSE
jgi:hypothetical protein